MRTATTMILALLFAGELLGAPPEGPKAPVAAKVGETVQVEVKFDSSKTFLWTPGFDTAKCLVARMYDERAGYATFWVQPKAEGDFYVTMILKGEDAFSNFIVSSTPRIPDPPPKPPEPPKPESKKLHRVLFLFESNAKMTPDQLNALNSAEVRRYMDANCIRDSDGRAGYRYWDPYPPPSHPFDVSREPQEWQDIWAAVQPKLSTLTLPVMVVGTGGKGDIYPITNEADMLATLKTYEVLAPSSQARKGKK